MALRWAADNDADLGLEMSAALWRWWLTSGRLAAGRGWLGRFLAGTAQRRDEGTGRAFCSAAVLAVENGDYPEGVRLARTGLGIFETLGLRERSAFAATVLGSAHRYLGDREAASRCFQTAMDLRAKLGDRRGVSLAMNNLALMALDDGDLSMARQNLEQALVIKRQLGDQNSLAIGLVNLSDVLIRTGELDAGRRALDEAAEVAGGVGNPHVTGLLEANRGFLAAEQERWAEAAGHYQAAAFAHEESGHAHDVVVALTGLGRAVHQLGRPDEAARHLRAAEALAAGIANPQRLAEVRAALAEIGESSDCRRPARWPHRPPGRRPAAARRRAEQQADRRRAAPEPADHRAPSGHRLPEAGPGRPGRGRPLCRHARPGRPGALGRAPPPRRAEGVPRRHLFTPRRPCGAARHRPRGG